MEEEIRQVQREVDYCKNYRDVEQHKNKKRINLLEADIDDIEASFQEMKCKSISVHHTHEHMLNIKNTQHMFNIHLETCV